MRSRKYRMRLALSLFWILAAVVPAPLVAGMPYVPPQNVIRSLRFTDPAEMRLQEISFFLMALLLCAGLIRWLWNWLAQDIRWMPPLTFGKAIGLVVLWGLLFWFVLNLIAGARELMTPGAWQHRGATYELRHSP